MPLNLKTMTWQRIIVDNCTLEGAPSGTDENMAMIFRFEGKSMNLWITERYHGVWKKYYVDCPKLGIYEVLIAAACNTGRRLGINRALDYIGREMSSRDLEHIKDLDQALVELGER